MYPIRYFNGEIKYSEVDIPDPRGSQFFGMTRVYSNTIGHGQLTWGWFIQQWPYLVLPPSPDDYEGYHSYEYFNLVCPGGSISHFVLSGDGVTYVTTPHVDNVSAVVQTGDDENSLDIIVSWAGNKLYFHWPGPINDIGLVSQFRFTKVVDAFGVTTQATYYTYADVSESGDTWLIDKMAELRRTYPDSDVQESIQYTYDEITATTDHPLVVMASATYRRRPNVSTDWTYLRKVNYDRYTSAADDTGTEGEIEQVTRQIATATDGSAWRDTSYSHYRYYERHGDPDSFEDDVAVNLKYIVGPEAYRRMVAASLDPLTESDTTLQSYADHYFEYSLDSSYGSSPFFRSVTKEVAQGACSGCGGGSGGTTGDTFEYLTNTGFGTPTGAALYNTWKTRTIVTHPDGNKDIVYTNFYTQPMLRIREETGSSSPVRRWADYFQYDDSGRRIWHAMPSAVALPNTSDALSTLESTLEGSNDLLGLASGNYAYLNDSTGLIDITAYYTASDGDGSKAGELKARYVQHGELGSPILVSSFDYDVRTVGSNSIRRPTTMTSYPSTSDPGITTYRSYTYYSGSTAVQRCATTMPTVTTAQNGSNSAATTLEEYDTYGDRTWLQDERGILTNWTYDTTNFCVTQMIQDVNSSTVSPPTDFSYSGGTRDSNVSGSALHLVTDYAYDDLGRLVQTLGPTHQVVLSGTSTAVRSATWNFYDEQTGGDEIRSAAGYATGSGPSYTFAVVGPGGLSKFDRAGRKTDSIATTQPSSNDLSGSFAQSTWVAWSHTDYRDDGTIADRQTYTSIPSSGSGSSGTNYDETDYGYDVMKRLCRAVSPGGTITRTVYDAVGRFSSSWIGTNDTPTTHTHTPAWIDWSPSNTSGADLVEISSSSYDGGNAYGDGNLTASVQYVDGSTTRTTNFAYDWRDRRTSVDGEIDLYNAYTYDNINRITQTDRYDTSSSGHLIGRSTKSYDNLGRVYTNSVYAVDPSSGSVGNSVFGNSWYDASGNVIKSIGAGDGKVASKFVYDGLGRTVKQSRGYDASETSYSDAFGVTSDTLATQSEYLYDAANELLQTTTHERLASDTGTGDLSSARISYRVTWYDGIGRSIASINYGTNGGTAITTSLSSLSTIPSRSDTILLTEMYYDSAGLAYRTVDPKAIDNRKYFDAARRVTKTVEAYDDGDYSTGSTDRDRTTEYAYTADGQIKTITARNSGTGDQVTTYAYGTTTSESGVATSNLLRGVIYPDSDDTVSYSGAAPSFSNGTDSAYDRVEMTYNRLGQIATRKDQRGVVHTYDYDLLGRLSADRITTASTADSGILGIYRTYEVRGMLSTVKSTSSATSGSGTTLNLCTYSYNTFGQLSSEEQSILAAGSTQDHTVSYAYADGSSSSNTIRKTSTTYPNSRVVYSLYVDAGGSSGISDHLNRVSAISGSSSRSSESAVIAGYSYLGMNTPVIKDYPQPQIKMDLTASSYAGLDNFGRLAQMAWSDYSGTAYDVFHLNYGYDRDSNRTYSQDIVYAGYSSAYTYDNLNRLNDAQKGLMSSAPTLDTYWSADRDTYSLDALGNQTTVQVGADTADHTSTFNKANELSTRKSLGRSINPRLNNRDDFGSTSTHGNFVAQTGSPTFDVNTTNSGRLTISALIGNAVLTWGNEVPSSYQASTSVKFPSGATSGQAGIVFGYKSSSDYYAAIYDKGAGQGKVIHFTSGSSTTLNSFSTTVAAGTDLVINIGGSASGLGNYPWFTTISGGFPSGKMGLFSNLANVSFDYISVSDPTARLDVLGRWSSQYWQTDSAANGLLVNNDTHNLPPVLLKNLRLNKFQMTLAMRRVYNDVYTGCRVVFNAEDDNTWDSIQVVHYDSAGIQPVVCSSSSGYGASGSGLPAAPSQSSVLWVRVEGGPGTSNEEVKLWAIYKSSTDPAPTESDWSGATMYFDHTGGFRNTGGMVGLAAPFTGGGGYLNNVTIKSWNSSSSAWVTEQVEPFTTDSSGYTTDTVAYDLAGNLTYDGSQAYTYDAWNRLTQVAHAYKDSGGTLHVGQTFQSDQYDGKGRRTVKAVSGTGEWDCTYVYYYDGDRQIEARNGSDGTIKQQVWGVAYIDELVQVGDHNSDDDENQVNPYWVMQDANFNVLGIWDPDSGALKERYQYSPYGQRTVLTSAGSNDPILSVSSSSAPRGKDTALDYLVDPYGLCEFGHQGLMHDEETGLVYNRLRYLEPPIGEFSARDSETYVNGYNLYGYEAERPTVNHDPLGTFIYPPWLPPPIVGGGTATACGEAVGAAAGGGIVVCTGGYCYLWYNAINNPSPNSGTRFCYWNSSNGAQSCTDGRPIQWITCPDKQPKCPDLRIPDPRNPECQSKCDKTYDGDSEDCDRFADWRTQSDCHRRALTNYSNCIRNCNRMFPDK